MVNKVRTVSYREYLHKEYEIHHAPYQPEMDFYSTIQKGLVDKTQELCNEPFHLKKGFGTLSKDKLQNLKYHFAISAALIARSCIDGGLSVSESYSMSDYYIQKADICTNIEDISVIHDEMCLHYANKMKQLRTQRICVKQVTSCIDYIYENLHKRITLETLAQRANLSTAYLSRLFKKETGYTISEYILAKKIETAKSMLAYTDYSISEISTSLAFPSQSYFTNVLKKDCGLTPKQYRDQNHSRLKVK